VQSIRKKSFAAEQLAKRQNKKSVLLILLVILGFIVIIGGAFVITLTLPLSQRSKAGKKVTISGTVTFGNKPVEGAGIFLCEVDESVHAIPKFGRKTDTASDGSFSFSVDEKELIRTEQFHSIVAAYSRGFTVKLSQIPDSTDAPELTFRLEQAGSVAGTVLDLDGNPVQDARVYPTILGYEHKGEEEFAIGAIPGLETTTNAEGHFILNDVPPNHNLNTEVLAKGFARRRMHNLEIGSTDNVVALVPEGVVEGTVIYENDGSPASNIKLVLAPRQYPYYLPVTIMTDENGSFTFRNLATGTHNLSIDWRGKSEIWAADLPKIIVHQEARFQNYEITLIKGGIIKGTIEDNGGTPMPCIGVFSQGMFTETDATGRYQIHVPPGEVYINCFSPIEYSSVRKDGEKRVPIRIEDGQTVNGEDFVLSPRVTIASAQMSGLTPEKQKKSNRRSLIRKRSSGKKVMIEGKVINTEGKPIIDARVFDRQGYSSGFDETRTGKEGTFKLEKQLLLDQLPVKIDHPLYGSYTYHELPDKKNSMYLFVLKAAPYEFRGKLLNSENQPIEGADVKLLNVDLPPERNVYPSWPPTGKSNSIRTYNNGVFYFHNLPDSSVTIQISREGKGTKTFESIDISSGEVKLVWEH